MKLIGLTQRVDWIGDYGEKRDALDQRWSMLLYELGGLAVPLPNRPEMLPPLLKRLALDGIILTGGNSPQAYGGTTPERDETDALLLDYAARQNIPLLGVCRGMQSILLHFGAALVPVEHHVAVRHKVDGRIHREVNSFHSLGTKEAPPGLRVLAQAPDGVVEAVAADACPFTGIMWHPERETPFCRDDKERIGKALQLSWKEEPA